jgi:hypothetical protein
MSRGLGRIERAIITIVSVDDEDVVVGYDAQTLALQIYQPAGGHRRQPTQAEHVAVLRAMHSLMRKFPDEIV